MKRLLKRLLLPFFDMLLVPLVYPAAHLLKYIRLKGVQQLPRCKQTLLAVGVFPIRNHYYEPQFDMSAAKRHFSEPRSLPGIDWNIPGQLQLLEQLAFACELQETPRTKSKALEFYLDNGAFEAGNAEYWYQLIRLKKPRRVFEIGSGHSTLMAVKAIRQNRAGDDAYACHHVCIEPLKCRGWNSWGYP